MFIRRQTISHPKSGLVIKGSNIFKIKPFNVFERQIDRWLFLSPSDSAIPKQLVKSFLLLLAFLLVLKFDLLSNQWVQHHTHDYVMVVSPFLKLAIYLTLVPAVYRFLKAGLNIILRLIKALLVASYELAYKKSLISVNCYQIWREQALTFEDFHYQPHRKYHRRNSL